jgi:urea carboxylase
VYSNAWEVAVLYGPHGAPDFFLDDDITMFFETEWRVHHHSNRTGVRLIGPKPKWARLDGGEAGLHPSNLHDNAYAVGAIDFTGDMPIILGPDGPSLGGFVCPAVIVDAELWKVGQLRPGDSVRFCPVTYEHAEAMSRQLDAAVAGLAEELPPLPADVAVLPAEPAILQTRPSTERAPRVVTRADGDRYVLVEFGENVLDIELRLRVHALEANLRALALPGIVDITPGVRSLQVHYDTRRLPRQEILDALEASERAIAEDLDITVPSRVLHLPLSWNDPQTRLAAEKYMQAVRPDAPWCPDNIEFIRRINGLEAIDDVHRIIFDASYLVLGLGDVYLGAPVATPTDPRHRLVTTKYNPARTWTPENAVGIGGAYMCIYGMEGPGGYQLFGRTLQVWNTFKSTAYFEPGTPWLLRFFDRIHFYPVGAGELLEMRDAFRYGKCSLRVEPGEFRYRDYLAFLRSIDAESKIVKARQQQAFGEERARWAAAGQAAIAEPISEPEPSGFDASVVPDGCEGVSAPLTANVWKVLVEPGQKVAAGESLIVLEAMKTEVMVVSPIHGTVEEVRARPDSIVSHGQTLIVLLPA